MQMRDPQRGAILQILRHQLEFYERKKDEDEADEVTANRIIASRQAARASAEEEAPARSSRAGEGHRGKDPPKEGDA